MDLQKQKKAWINLYCRYHRKRLVEISTAELEKENPKVHWKFLANLHQNDISEERVLKKAFAKEKVRTERKLRIV